LNVKGFRIRIQEAFADLTYSLTTNATPILFDNLVRVKPLKLRAEVYKDIFNLFWSACPAFQLRAYDAIKTQNMEVLWVLYQLPLVAFQHLNSQHNAPPVVSSLVKKESRSAVSVWTAILSCVCTYALCILGPSAIFAAYKYTQRIPPRRRCLMISIVAGLTFLAANRYIRPMLGSSGRKSEVLLSSISGYLIRRNPSQTDFSPDSRSILDCNILEEPQPDIVGPGV